MNIYVVRRATQGLANYIIRQGGSKKGVAIAYDSRHMSPEFADEAARTRLGNMPPSNPTCLLRRAPMP